MTSPTSRLQAFYARSTALSPGDCALIAVSLAWTAVLVLILSHSLFVTNDSLNNYVHVWYAGDRLWHGHGIPLHMPVLGHGKALAFPYAFLPWLSAALVRPLLGDWAVTLWLVLGFLGLVGSTLWALPELRRGWWAAILLVNPLLVEAPLLGQLPFIWAAAFLLLAVGAWRRRLWLIAGIALGLAQATHPAVLLPIAGVMVVGRLPMEPERLRLLEMYALSLLIAFPAALLVLASPVVEDTSTRALVLNFLGTTMLRAVLVAGPFAFLALMRSPAARVPALIFLSLIVANLCLVPVRHDQFAWGALFRSPDHSLESFTASSAFRPGATYRILRVADGKVGMYDLLRAGARLDSELFPESIDRRSWPDRNEYINFLEKRGVDYVIIYNAYDRRYRTNEHALLEVMSSPLTAINGDSGLLVQRLVRTSEYDVYSVGIGARALVGPGSHRE